MGTAAVDQLIPLLASNTSTIEIGKRDIPTSGENDGNQDANSAIQKLLDDNRNVLQTKAQNTVSPRRVSCQSSGSHKFTVINYGKVKDKAKIPELDEGALEQVPTNPDRLPTSSSAPALVAVLRRQSSFSGLRQFTNVFPSHNRKRDLQKSSISAADSQDSKPEVPPPKYPTNDDAVYLTVGNAHKSGLGDVAKRGRMFAKRNRFRLFHRSGECNMTSVKVDKQGARYLSDLFTTLLEMKWRYNIVVYLVSFVLSWVLFALAWWAVHAFYDLDEDGTPCVVGVQDFKSALLFSVETQHTIGYGSRSITDRCGLAYILLMLQSVFGAVTQCVVTGVIFAKLSRPNQRGQTILFSKRAVICSNCDCPDQELGSTAPTECKTSIDAPLSLEFRVGDMRNSQLIGVQLNAILIKKTMSDDERRVDLRQERLHISTESGDDYYFLAWPIKICHRIDKESPLWNMSPEKLLETEWEILVILEANCEATGGTIQVRASYLLSEIMWGHCLAPLVTYQKGHGQCKVDYSQFNEVIPVDTPELSAKEIYERHTRDIRTPRPIPKTPSFANDRITRVCPDNRVCPENRVCLENHVFPDSLVCPNNRVNTEIPGFLDYPDYSKFLDYPEIQFIDETVKC